MTEETLEKAIHIKRELDSLNSLLNHLENEKRREAVYSNIFSILEDTLFPWGSSIRPLMTEEIKEPVSKVLDAFTDKIKTRIQELNNEFEKL